MKLKGKRAQVTIALLTSERTRSVPALVFGPYLALIPNREVDGPGARGWTISHIPTGLQILRAKTQKEGRLLIEQLLLLDWTPKVARTNGPAVRRIAAEIAPNRRY